MALPLDTKFLILSYLPLTYLIKTNINDRYPNIWTTRYLHRYDDLLTDLRLEDLSAKELYLLKAGYDQHEVCAESGKVISDCRRLLYAALKSENWDLATSLCTAISNIVTIKQGNKRIVGYFPSVIVKMVIESDRLDIIKNVVPFCDFIPLGIVIKSDVVGEFLLRYHFDNNHFFSSDFPIYDIAYHCSLDVCKILYNYIIEIKDFIENGQIYRFLVILTGAMFHSGNAEKISYLPRIWNMKQNKVCYYLDQIAEDFQFDPDGDDLGEICYNVFEECCPNIFRKLLSHDIIDILSQIFVYGDVIYFIDRRKNFGSGIDVKQIAKMISELEPYKDNPIIMLYYLLYKTLLGTLDNNDLEQVEDEMEDIYLVMYDICVRTRQFKLIKKIQDKTGKPFLIGTYHVEDIEFALFCLDLKIKNIYELVLSVSFVDQVKNKELLEINLRNSMLSRLVK